jgi:DNA-binding MarR family transcriptional regulator
MDESDLLIADRIAQEVGRLGRIVTALRRHRGDIAVAHVLVQLIDQGPQRVSAIADAVGTDASTVSRKAAELVAAGLVERRADPDDGRAHLLAVTPAGARICEDGRRKRVELVASVLSGWPEESRRRLAELLGRFADDVQDAGRRVSRRPGGEN